MSEDQDSQEGDNLMIDESFGKNPVTTKDSEMPSKTVKPYTGKKRGRPPKDRSAAGQSLLLGKETPKKIKKKKDEEETGHPSSASSSPKKMNKTLKMKDPNAPHRPVNPFMLYLRRNRARMKQQHPEAAVPDVTKLLSQEWMKLSEEDKKPYAEEAAALKVKYLQDLSAYMESDAHQSFKRGLLAKQSKKGAENVVATSSSLVVPKKRGRPRKIRPGEEAPSLPSPPKTAVKTRIPLQVKKESQVNQTVSIGNIKVFTDEFLENNRERESELRKLRKLATDFEEQNAILSKHIDNMKAAESKLTLEMHQMNERNQSVEEHLLRLKKEFVECFATVAIPGTKEYPSLETVDEYLDKLHRKLTQGRASADSSPQDTQSIRDKVVDFVTRFANLDVEV